MATSRTRVRPASRTARKPAGAAPRKTAALAAARSERPPILYVHGIGEKPPADVLKREWDLALFGRDMGARTRMAYWADILHGAKQAAAAAKRTARAGASLDPGALLAEAGVDPDDADARALTEAWLAAAGIVPPGPRRKVLPLPAFLRKPLARKFIEALIKDSAAYFFKADVRARIRARFEALLPAGGEPVVIVAHSQGTVVALEVLAARAKQGRPVAVEQFVTLGSPLGIREVQDVLEGPLEVPRGVARWHNFADPLDPVALDKGLGNDFGGAVAIDDEMIMNTEVRRLDGFNPHSAVGYLSHPKVRRVVQDAARFDIHARFLVARDVAAGLAVEQRQPVLVEILEPGYPALEEPREETALLEASEGIGAPDLRQRIAAAAAAIEAIVREQAVARVAASRVEAEVEAARIDPLRRYVAARLAPAELMELARLHRELRVYAVWKSTRKRKLIHRSVRVVQADAAWASYGAQGAQVCWAVLDTGVRRDHPHFATHGNIEEVWDCTQPGAPKAVPNDADRDGHGTHVSGIIAGEVPEAAAAAAPDVPRPRGVAPRTRLVVYKVLDERGYGEDAWIIKALDHIAERNGNSADLYVDGLNLSLGGPYDSTVYGCGFSPICTELRRQWRSGVLVVVAAGNEGQTEVSTPDGEVELNTSLSIGDPANLDDCIAVGSVHADRPHLYGVSAFSSRGPTSDGRVKPDVVAPGERIRSCDSRFRQPTMGDLYREESGTSMAAPHVSGLLAAFLSVRREFRGRPDEVKALLLRTCIDLGRDRYHQGHGLPNLMRMLLEA
jgi:subtilisin family serine protease